MDIADFIPSYPYRNARNFNREIQRKKEFYDLRADNPDPEIEKDNRWKHQELIARYAGPDTSYNEQILFHTPGTGKTCGSIAVIEDIIQSEGKTKNIIIVPNEGLANQWENEIAFKCSSGQYIPENYFSTDPETMLTEGEKTRRFRDLIKKNYMITTMGSFGNLLSKISDENIVRRFKNVNIIIDEVHKLREKVVVEKDIDKDKNVVKKDYYKEYYNFLHLVSGKKLLLTGTPMTDNVDDIANIFNLLLPIDQKLPTGKDFMDRYFDKDDLINTDELEKKIRGLISYVTVGDLADFPERIDMGSTVFTDYVKTVDTEMSDIQLKGYKKAIEKDSKKKGIYDNQTDAINFVYPLKIDGKTKYLWGKAATDVLMKTIGKRDALNVKYVKDIRENLKKYSSKLYKVYRIAKENPDKPIFVYNEKVSGAGGSKFQAAVLRMMGIKTEIITGKDKAGQKDKIKRFNSKKNRDASLIHVLIGSETISTGTSLITPKISISFSPWWNSSRTEQAVSRAIRADSLNWLPKDERKVEVYQLAAVSDKLKNSENVDVIRFVTSERKDVAIKHMERFIKETSWDCSLNYTRNVVRGQDNSRDCDYQSCEWKCSGIESNTLDYKDIEWDTWLLYYSEPAREKIRVQLKERFQRSSVIDLRELLENISFMNEKLLVLTLENFVKSGEKVLNRWGIPCYVRIDGDYLYLSDSFSISSGLSDVIYTDNPYVNEYKDLSEIINEDDYKSISLFTKESINRYDLHTQSKIFEDLYKMFLKYEKEGKKDRADKVSKVMNDLFGGRYYIPPKSVLSKSKTETIAVNYILKDIKNLDYIDFSSGADGSIRCYNKRLEEWVNCNKADVSKFSKKPKSVSSAATTDKEDKDISNITDNVFKTYIKFTDKGSGMQIVDLSKQKQSVKDMRSVYTGKDCKSWRLHELLPLLVRIGYKPDYSGYVFPDSVKKMRVDLERKTEFAKKIGLDSIKDEDIKIYYYLSKQSVSTLCSIVKKFFEDRNLFIDARAK